MIDFLKEKLFNYTFKSARQFKESKEYTDPNDLIVSKPLDVWGLPNNSFGYFLWIQFHHNKRTDPFPIYEKINDGYLYYTDSTCVYFSSDDLIYKVTCTHKSHDWEMHQRLYELTLQRNIDIEIPIDGQKFYKENKEFWYTVVQRPNMFQRIDPHQLHIENKITKEWLIKIFDATIEYSKIIKKLDDTYHKGCPNFGSLIIKYMIDPNDISKGIWTDIKHWVSSYADYKKYTLNEKKDYFYNFNNSNLSDYDKQFLLNYLEKNL
jgi:hypothetical protein